MVLLAGDFPRPPPLQLDDKSHVFTLSRVCKPWESFRPEDLGAQEQLGKGGAKPELSTPLAEL